MLSPNNITSVKLIFDETIKRDVVVVVVVVAVVVTDDDIKYEIKSRRGLS